MTEQEKKRFIQSRPKRIHGHQPYTIRETLAHISDAVNPDWMPDHYGSGVAIQSFEKQIAKTLGKEAALFFPSGTMAQQVALRFWAEKKKNFNVAMHLTCHLEVHEEMGYRLLHGLNGIPVGSLLSPLTLKDLKQKEIELGSIVLELPQRHSGGALPTWPELSELLNWGRDNGQAMHLDGARLWETAAYYKRSYEEICAGFDSVYVSFYKGLGSIGGAALAGPEELIEAAKIWQRRHGGNLIHLYPQCLSSQQGFELRLKRMPAYFSRAEFVHGLFSELNGISVYPQQLQTNMMHLAFAQDPSKVQEALYLTAQETDTCIGVTLWDRPFADESILEIYIGDGALALSENEIETALSNFHEKLSQTE